MNDCVGNKIYIGDKVICSDMKYADLLIGVVVGFTPMKARIRYVRSENYRRNGSMGEQLKESYQIFVYEHHPTVLNVPPKRWLIGYGEEDFDVKCPVCGWNDIFDVCTLSAVRDIARQMHYCQNCGERLEVDV